MPPPLRRPSRSVKVPGRVSRPVRLGHQSTGSLFAPDHEWAHTSEEEPHGPRGPVTPPRRPEDAAPEDTHDGAAQAEASPGGAGAPDPSPAETRPAEVTPADARQADGGPSGTGPADSAPADGGPSGTGPADGGPSGTGPADDGPADGGPADGGPADGSAVPAVRPGGAPAARPEALPAARAEAARPEAAQPEAPAARPEATPAVRPAARAPARRPAAEPSWGTVLVTTFRLWAKRRRENPWWRALGVLVLAAIMFLAGALTVTLTRSNPASKSATGQRTGQRTGQGTIPGGSGALAAVTAARKKAATWVAHQVNPDEVIGCDPVMCAALETAHIQANRLLVLGPNLPDPLGSEILLDTAVLRSQFGSRLETVYAPVSLAAFGSGAARVEVRFVAPGGARAYLAQLAGDVAARRSAGTQMLRNRAIHASPSARGQLTAGQVDTRLLVTLVTLAHSHPVHIISFGTNQAGASPGVPLRSAEFAGAPGPGSTPAASVQTLRSFLSAQQPPYRPSVIAVTTASGRAVLRVGYPAPSLLGLLGTHG